MEKTIELDCGNCNRIFTKIAKEYRRQIKKGNTRFFCSLSCTCLKRNAENPPKGNVQNLTADNRRDEFTPFRWFLNHAQSRNKNRTVPRDFNLTIDYLKTLWEKQEGVCPFTNWKLILPYDCDGALQTDISNASLDRIDNSKGYIVDNVRFVCVMANFARNKFTDDQLLEFCKAVANK